MIIIITEEEQARMLPFVQEAVLNAEMVFVARMDGAELIKHRYGPTGSVWSWDGSHDLFGKLMIHIVRLRALVNKPT